MTDTTGASRADDRGAPARLARFGTWELDLRSGELRRGGVRVPLQDQPLRLLVFLLEHPGEVVTREELRARLWPSEFVDFDHSLNAAVRKLRTALDDSADNPRFVETLARRGYRFIAPVTWAGKGGPEVEESLPGPPAVPVPVERRGRSRWLLAIAAAVLLVAAGAVWFSRRTTVGPISAIAVLPFTNSAPQDEHISDGVTEILIDRLSRLSDLRVMARSTVFEYKGKRIVPARAGRELDVGAVVSGHVRRHGDGYSIHVELIDVQDGTQLWGRSYESSAGDLPLTQGRIGDDLTEQLRRTLTPEERQQASRGTTTNPQAYEHYLRGLYLWNQRDNANLHASLAEFQRAVALDPAFAAAWAGQANAYGVMTGRGLLTPEQGTLNVLATARKALEFDPNSAEAYTSLATTAFRNLWDFSGAERDYRRAIALNPNYATAHQWYADYLRAMGRPEEAWREILTARRLDPYSAAVKGSYCGALVTERRFDEAMAFAASERRAGRSATHCAMAVVTAKGDFEGLLRETQQLPAGDKRRAWATVHRADGIRGLYRARLEALLGRPNPAQTVPVDIAETYMLLGDHDEAFAWLEKGLQHRVSSVTSFHLSPAFDPVRDDPRFLSLATRIGIPPVALEVAKGYAARAAKTSSATR